MSFSGNLICIYSTSQEHQAVLVEDKLHLANIEVISLNKKDSSYGTFGQIELYVPAAQEAKARTIIQAVS